MHFASILDFIFHILRRKTWGQKVLKWSPLLGVLNFRLEALEFEFWIVHHSSIHHHSHCYWIPLTAMMEWVASVIWGRAKTGTAVSRYSCKLDSSWGWPCNISFLLSKTSLDYKWTCVSASFTFLLLKMLCMGSTFSFETVSPRTLKWSIKFGCDQSVSGLGQVIWTSFVLLRSENVVVYSDCKYNSDKSFCLQKRKVQIMIRYSH